MVMDKQQRPPTEHETRVYKVLFLECCVATLPCIVSRPKHAMQACSLIPPGKVSTYGALATVLKSAPRAVGQVGAVCCNLFAVP